jgi:signal transduction histidine kinase
VPINRPDAEDGLRKQEMSRLALPCQKPVSSRTRRPQRRTANAGAAAGHPGCSEHTASPAPTGNRANSESYCFEQRSRTAIVVASLRQDDPQRSLAFSAQPGLRAHGDPLLLRIVMENLLGNAWKFTGKRADASIGVGSVREGAETIYFVRDNGAGFDMDYKDKLFGAFQRLHDANEFPGSGIGLATVERIVHRHGGRIWAESVAGKGSTFYFTLGEAENNDVSADKR